MKKYIRGLYLAVCYVVGLPILFLMNFLGGIYSIVKLKYEGYGCDMEDIKEWVKASYEGLRTGHKINMYYVKYGTKEPFDMDKMLKEL